MERGRAPGDREFGHDHHPEQLRQQHREPVRRRVARVGRRDRVGRRVRLPTVSQLWPAGPGEATERPDRVRDRPDRAAGGRGDPRHHRRLQRPRMAVCHADHARRLCAVDVRHPAHAVRTSHLRGRRQQGGSQTGRDQRLRHRDRRVRDLQHDGGARRHRPGVEAELGRHLNRRRHDPAVLDRGGGDRRHEPVRRAAARFAAPCSARS